MPKQVLKIDRFEGGLNTNSDPRDIGDNQLAECTDIIVSNVGKIVPIGSQYLTSQSGGNPSDPAAGTLYPGYGLFGFGHDRKNGHVPSGEALQGSDFLTNSNSEWAITSGSGAGGVDIVTGVAGGLYYNENGGSWASDTVVTQENKGSTGTDVMDEYLFNSTEYVANYIIGETANTYTTPDGNFALTLSGITDAPVTLPDSKGAHSVEFTTSSDVYNSASKHLLISTTVNDALAGEFAILYFSIRPTSFDSTPTGDNYLSLQNSNTNNFQIFSYNNNIWSPGDLIHMDGSATGKGVYYVADGSLRIADANFANDEDNVWLGYVVRNRFKGATYAHSIHRWHQTTPEIKAPIAGRAGAAPTYPINSSNLQLLFNGTTGTWPNSVLQFAYTYIYDDTQESPLFTMADGDSPLAPGVTGTNTLDAIDVFVSSVGEMDEYSLDPRISGSNFYYRVKDSEDPNWYFLLYADYYNGVTNTPWQTGELSGFVEWDDGGGALHKNLKRGRWTTDIDDPPELFTYETLSGIPQNTGSLKIDYKAAVVASRRAYVGNIRYIAKDGTKQIKGDAMIKSLVNQFDTFPEDNIIEVTINDGDDIVALAEYADRILQFKRNKLHIINISQEIEFLEDTVPFRGVSHPSAVFSTPKGVAWANENGVFLYNGTTILELFERNNQKTISLADWESHYTSNTQVGYIPKSDQIVVMKDSTASSNHDADILLYDLTTQSWIKGEDSLKGSGAGQTNFIVDKNNDLFWQYGGAGYPYKWVNTPSSSSNVVFKTKDIDFGNPAVRKKVFKVYVTYTGGTAGPQPEKTRVVCTDDLDDSLAGKYFLIYGATGKTLVWLDVDNDNSPSIPTGLSEDLVLEVQGIATNDPAEKVAIEIANTVGDHAEFLTEVNGDTVTITDAANATRTNAADGDTGFTVTTVQEGTASTVAQNIDVTYATNGGSSYSQFDANLTDSTGNQVEVELTPSAPINNIKSFQLKFDGTAAASFELNDISIIHRIKNVK